MSSSDTLYSEGDPLLSPNGSVYYESFPRAPSVIESVPESVESKFGDLSRRISASRVWVISGWQQTSAWLAGGINRRKLFRRKNLSPAIRNGIAVCIMGIAAALVAFVVDISESHMVDWKYGFCTTQWTASKLTCCSGYTDCPAWQTWSAVTGIDNHKLSALNFFLYLALVVLLSSLSYVLTRYTRAGKRHHHLSDSLDTEEKEASPQYYAAAGSGVLEVKQALMGSQEKAPWKVSTLVLKTLALVMSTSSGLSVGKEGPYIHLSASAADLINNSFTSLLRIPRPKALSIGSAAGLSAAFDAPVSGAVFVMEGLGQRLSSISLALLLAGGVVAAVTLKGFDPYGGNKAIPFEVRYTTSWTYNELPIFLAVGAAGGVLGALFTGSVRLWSSSYRQLGLVKRHPVIDVLLVALATALTSFWNKYLRFGTAELLSQLMTPYMQMSSMPAESSGSSPTEEVADTLGSLGIALLIKFALTVITFGTQIPQGIYMPSMAIGAMLGRFVGQSTHVLFHDSMVLGSSVSLEPAVYTMAGAGAVMAAIMRWHFSVVAIVFELSRSWTYIFPFTLAIYTAKALAAYLEPQGIYDLVAELHGETSLDTILKTSDTKIEDCLEAPNSQTPAINLISEFVTQVHILRTLLDDTEAAGVHALPIMKQTTFIGCVSTRGFREILTPLDGYLQVALTQGASKSLDISIVHGASDSRNCDFGTAEEQSPKTYAHLVIDYPAIFDSCSTLLSLYTYFKDSDVEYVCVRRWGMFRTVVSNPLQSVDLLLTTVFDTNHPRKLVSKYIEKVMHLSRT